MAINSPFIRKTKIMHTASPPPKLPPLRSQIEAFQRFSPLQAPSAMGLRPIVSNERDVRSKEMPIQISNSLHLFFKTCSEHNRLCNNYIDQHQREPLFKISSANLKNSLIGLASTPLSHDEIQLSDALSELFVKAMYILKDLILQLRKYRPELHAYVGAILLKKGYLFPTEALNFAYPSGDTYDLIKGDQVNLVLDYFVADITFAATLGGRLDFKKSSKPSSVADYCWDKNPIVRACISFFAAIGTWGSIETSHKITNFVGIAENSYYGEKFIPLILNYFFWIMLAKRFLPSRIEMFYESKNHFILLTTISTILSLPHLFINRSSTQSALNGNVFFGVLPSYNNQTGKIEEWDINSDIGQVSTWIVLGATVAAHIPLHSTALRGVVTQGRLLWHSRYGKSKGQKCCELMLLPLCFIAASPWISQYIFGASNDLPLFLNEKFNTTYSSFDISASMSIASVLNIHLVMLGWLKLCQMGLGSPLFSRLFEYYQSSPSPDFERSGSRCCKIATYIENGLNFAIVGLIGLVGGDLARNTALLGSIFEWLDNTLGQTTAAILQLVCFVTTCCIISALFTLDVKAIKSFACRSVACPCGPCCRGRQEIQKVEVLGNDGSYVPLRDINDLSEGLV